MLQQGEDCPSGDDSLLCGDAAENSIPRYILTATGDNGKEQTCRATENQTFVKDATTTHSVGFRHSFRDSMAVLAGMMALLVVTVIVILRRRDNDPQ
jgi:hypothetical protein